MYLGLAALLATTALSIPAVSLFLQKYMHLVLAPIFLFLGMFLVGLITVSSGGTMMTEKMQNKVDSLGMLVGPPRAERPDTDRSDYGAFADTARMRQGGTRKHKAAQTA